MGRTKKKSRQQSETIILDFRSLLFFLGKQNRQLQFPCLIIKRILIIKYAGLRGTFKRW